MAFKTDGVPLGIAWHKNWVRTEIETGKTAAEKKKERNATPIEDKESIRWIEGHREALRVARECPKTRCIPIGHSEADIYELFSESRDTGHNRPLEILISGCQERATTQSGRIILDHARATPCLYTATVNVSSRTAKTKVETRKRSSDRPARIANVEVRACKTTLREPWRHDRKLPDIPINIVLVEETGTSPLCCLV